MAKINKPVLLLGGVGMSAQMLTSLEDKVEFKTHESYMEDKVKSPKELKIKEVQSDVAIKKAEDNDDNGAEKSAKLSAGKIPLTNKQAKARAKNKRAKKARKLNRR